MNYLDLGGNDELKVSQIALGCMRMTSLSVPEAASLLETAVMEGINFFDHADIYGAGECERIFGEALVESGLKRQDIFIQSKCGIRDGSFDFSKEHIIASVDGSLKRLGVDYLDVLALHRPDTLVEPEEVAEAFDLLEQTGKVRHFGVSNQKPMQIELLQRSVSQKLLVNQLQFGVMASGLVDQGFHVNMKDTASIEHDGSVLDYSRLNNMTIQAWSPYQYGFFDGVFLGNEKFPELNKVIDRIADKYQVTNTGIATAWISRHPAKMQTILGTMKESRIKEVSQASDIVLTREEWYEIYRAAGNILP
ncbi:aldo/keto reductase [Vagococcus intermedius]|uniref:Aldo/keto reductase n=1 Tax=Vagococcus intermedius TaxID=2991418 RepID=A0AAF0CVZ8_9ENTE|nr:aldo/keto reductase [Vagococcus intermedius]WEG73894.1 aldo/keto reductase [Vagococcus intermedius]WEG75978.1 aldo/keto reductase [Vagococcus intermedius]